MKSSGLGYVASGVDADMDMIKRIEHIESRLDLGKDAGKYSRGLEIADGI